MKKLWLLLVVVSFFVCGTAFADFQLPSADTKVISPFGGLGFGKEYVKVAPDAEKGITIAIPLSERQKDGVPTLYFDFAEYIDGQWVKVAIGDYKVKTEKSGRYATATVKGTGKSDIIMLRGWGKVAKENKIFWLDINPDDELCRADKKGNIAYQFVTKISTGETKSVPRDYPAWE